jgi:predicted dehydrogenase
MIKAGLIGNGNIAGSHRKGYRRIASENGPVVIEACCDIRAERLENLGGERVYRDIDTMLAAEKGKLDYVDICLPTFLHADVAIRAMKAGFNVLCEKPMALNETLAAQMLETAAQTGKTLMIAHCNRFMDLMKVIRDICRSGELGAVRSAEFQREGGHRQPMGWNNWFRDGRLSGGAMLDLHVHDVDIINWLFGMPESVSAVAANVIPGSGYDSMSVNYHYSNGVFVHASCDWTIVNDQFNTRVTRVNFEKGYVYCDRTAGRQAFIKMSEDGTATDLSAALKSDFFYNEIMYYVDCLQNGRRVEHCPPEESIKAIRLVMAEMASADRGGEKVSLT